MKSITMTANQTLRYDEDDISLITELRVEADNIREHGETVEIYTDDGIVAMVVQD